MKRAFTFTVSLATLALVNMVLAQPQDTPGGVTGRDTAQPGQIDRDRDRMTGAGQIDDKDFIREAASGNQLEIQLSELVANRAQDQQIKRFAQQMVEDHRQAQQQLQPIAQKLGIQSSIDQLLPVHQAKLQHYQQKQGRALEISYIFDQVAHHVKDVLMYQFASQNAQDPQVKQFASQTLPKLREHLRTAEQIAPGGAEARTAGERIGPGE